MADTQDLFVERFNDDDGRPGYEFEGEWRRVEVVHEEIAVKGRSPEPLDVRQTHHGPIVNDALGARAGEPLALAWTGLQQPCLTAPACDAGSATSGEELVRGLARHAVPPLNMLWADRAATSATSSSASSRSAAAAARTCRSRAGPASSSGRARPLSTSCRARRTRRAASS